MDANQMKEELLIRLDSIYSHDTPGLLDSEIASILTEAEFDFVEENLPFIDSNDLVKADLKTLYTTVIRNKATHKSDSINAFILGEFWSIPDDIRKILSEEVKITSDISFFNNTYLPVIPKNYDEYNSNKKNPFKKSNRDKIWKLEEDTDKVQLIKSDIVLTIEEYKIKYIKKVQGIIPYITVANGGDGSTNALINSILPDITHNRIIDIAVRKALKYLGLAEQLQMDLAPE